MEWLFVVLLLVITVLAGLQLDSLYRIQAMHVSLLQTALAAASKKTVTELSPDLMEAIKKNTDHVREQNALAWITGTNW